MEMSLEDDRAAAMSWVEREFIHNTVMVGRWSDHPRVSMGEIVQRQANSWMVVPSMTMTE
jgi:hypothetical protein